MHRFWVEELAFGIRTGKRDEIAAETALKAAQVLLGKQLSPAVTARSAVARVQLLGVVKSPEISYFQEARQLL